MKYDTHHNNTAGGVQHVNDWVVVARGDLDCRVLQYVSSKQSLTDK